MSLIQTTSQILIDFDLGQLSDKSDTTLRQAVALCQLCRRLAQGCLVPKRPKPRHLMLRQWYRADCIRTLADAQWLCRTTSDRERDHVVQALRYFVNHLTRYMVHCQSFCQHLINYAHPWTDIEYRVQIARPRASSRKLFIAIFPRESGPIRISAPEAITNTLTWISKTLNDQNLFDLLTTDHHLDGIESRQYRVPYKALFPVFRTICYRLLEVIVHLGQMHRSPRLDHLWKQFVIFGIVWHFFTVPNHIAGRNLEKMDAETLVDLVQAVQSCAIDGAEGL